MNKAVGFMHINKANKKDGSDEGKMSNYSDYRAK